MKNREPQRSATNDHPSVIESLRVRAGEVQLGRVLTGICSDERCASAFARLLLRKAGRGSDLRVPRRTRVSNEVSWTRRLPGLDQDARARTDLYFEGKDFKLICELKINSGYQPKQLHEYLRRAPVIALVREPGKQNLSKSIQNNPNWLGEVAWGEIADDLERLPLDGAERDQWLDLMRVMREDGDFDEVQPPEVSKEDRAFALSVAEGVIDRLGRSRDPRAKALAGELEAVPLFDRAPWARAKIRVKDGDEFWRIGIKNRRLSTAVLRVSWMAWNPARRGQVAMYQELGKLEPHFTREYDGDQYRRQRSLPIKRGEDRLEQAATAAYEAAKAIVDVGLIDYELRFLGIDV